MSNFASRAVKRLTEIKAKADAAAEDREARAKRRLDICSRCDHYNATLKMCAVCGCVMPAKARLKNASCPKGFW